MHSNKNRPKLVPLWVPAQNNHISHRSDEIKMLKNRYLEDINEEEKTIRICGGIGSPYSNKMLAYVRYKRIPYRWVMMNQIEEKGLPHPRGPKLLPKIVFPDGSTMNDSTFLIKKLEKDYFINARFVFPPLQRKGFSFLVEIMEDWADEWLTKAMYHYRWIKDADFAAQGIAMQQIFGPEGESSQLEAVAKMVKDRQVSRLNVVGSTPETYSVIETCFTRFLELFDAHLAAGYRFLFGSRPSAADFAIFGQLHPMISLDPNTSHYIRSTSGRVCAWYATMLDLSGLSIKDESAGWLEDKPALPPTLYAIFVEVGKYYVPFMLANAKAFHRGEKEVTCYVGETNIQWKQPTFKYQMKCLKWIQESFEKLNQKDQNWVKIVLEGTGCQVLFNNNTMQKGINSSL